MRNKKSQMNKTNKRGKNQMQPDIIRGAKNGDIFEVQRALEQDKNEINRQDGISKMSALHYAAAKGNASMASYLLNQEGADITLKDRWNRDALDVAILSGNQDIVDDMFKFRHGDDPENKSEPEPEPSPSSPSVIPLRPR